MKQKTGRKLLSFLLTLAMVVGLVPGMSLTAYADDDPPYAQYKNTTTVVYFDSKEWYLIYYDDTTVTLLAKECVGASHYNTSGFFVEYSQSTVKTAVDDYYTKNFSADAQKAVSGNAMFLLTTSEANAITNADVLKCSQASGAIANDWWLCSQGSNKYYAAFVNGENGSVGNNGAVGNSLGVRPALKLNLESVIFSSESKTFSLKPAGYDVTITKDSNMTWTTTSGAESQTGVTGPITDVVYTANDGYYFPTDYSVTSVNGISVTRNSYTQITVSGTPTANASITLAAPTAKTKPAAPTTATAVDCTTTDNNDGKLTGVTTSMEYRKSDASDWIAGTGSDITGLVPGTYYVRLKATDTTTASDNQELTIAEYTIPTYKVTYKVVNGTWSDDTTTDKTENVQSGSTPASVPTGMKAASGYTGGAWDTDPTGTTINGATTFTYTFTALPTYKVTYKVVNGTWSDDSTADKTENVQSGSKPASVPTGMKAASGYTGGAWDTNPAEATITGATTFTYTFTALPTYQVTYRVVNGTWSDDTTTDKTETVQSGSTPASVPTGMKAASGYTGGAWDTNPAEATITGATTFTYTFTALPTYQVTYRVVNGTWSDDTTADKTETVQSGSTPASVPTGMKAASGYTGGAWDTNPAEATITGATTFTYTFTALPTYQVTYRVVNGTWSDDTTTDKTETVQSGSKPASVPTGMKAASGYTGGAWDTDPAGATITEATTFTYTFTAIPIYTVTVTNDGHGTGSAAPVSGAEGTEVTLNATPAEGYAFKEWQVVSGGVTVKDNKFTIGTANVEIKAVFEQAGDMEDEVIVEPGAPAVSGTNIDEVAAGVVTADEVAAGVKVWVDISPLAEAAVPAGDKALANQAMQGFGGTAGAWIDMSMFKQVTGQNKTAVHQTATAFRFSMKVPDSLKKAGRTFWLLRLHNDKADILATTTGDTLSGETNLFSTYLIAYKDAETPTPTPKPVPKTGDQDHPGLWIILMLIGIAGLTVIGTLKVSRKRK